jgi:hypothetical protein
MKENKRTPRPVLRRATPFFPDVSSSLMVSPPTPYRFHRASAPSGLSSSSIVPPQTPPPLAHRPPVAAAASSLPATPPPPVGPPPPPELLYEEILQIPPNPNLDRWAPPSPPIIIHRPAQRRRPRCRPHTRPSSATTFVSGVPPPPPQI